MGDDDDGSSRRSSPLDRSPRSPASRLGNARIANALACAPVTTESRDASARSGPADDARETEETDRSPAHRMSVYIGTWNVGNTAPRMDAAKAWLAPARGPILTPTLHRRHRAATVTRWAPPPEVARLHGGGGLPRAPANMEASWIAEF